MKKLLIIIILLISNLTFGQIKAIIIDSETKEKIPFVNIWIENESTGTTSNEKGEFSLDEITNDKTIIFSAIGFEVKKIKSGTIQNTVELIPKRTELEQVIISSKKSTEKIKIGSSKKRKIATYYACGIKPWISARFFEFKEQYYKTPYLKQISLVTNSTIKDAKFNVRLYSVNEKGKPGDFLYNKNIIGIAKKGKEVTEIDISEWKIRIPEEGLFVAIEWLIIEPNKREFIYTIEGSPKKFDGITYEPRIGVVLSETNDESWIYDKGNWRKMWKTDMPLTRFTEKYFMLAIELTLTN